jgi:hypothetical protein
MNIHEPLKLINTGNTEQDIEDNLKNVVKVMEGYIEQYPSEYMWFYKIWKYSKESTLIILTDRKAGHLRQSQNVAKMVERALGERNIALETDIINVAFRDKTASRMMSVLSSVVNSFIYQGRLEILKWFLTEESFKEIMSIKADFIVSCGSSLSGINCLLAHDQQAKSIVILKPGLLGLNRFDLVVLPQHDWPSGRPVPNNVQITKGAPNLINQEYLKDQSERLVQRYSHLKFRQRLRVGLLMGGDTKSLYIDEREVRIIINQLKDFAGSFNAEILVTTSRRTSAQIEGLLFRELKSFDRCPLLISSSRNNIPEAMGGILGLSDIIIVSGDSVSMISEAASSGKKTIVFPVHYKGKNMLSSQKHELFIYQLHKEGFVVLTDFKHIRQTLFDMAKNKIYTQRLDDNEKILEAVRHVI